MKNKLLDSFENFYCPFNKCNGKIVKIKENYHQCNNCGQVWWTSVMLKHLDMFKNEQKPNRQF
jgi:hypothetical protein